MSQPRYSQRQARRSQGIVVDAVGARTPEMGIEDGRIGAVGAVGTADEYFNAADLVVLSEDPTEAVTAWQTPETVSARGERS